METTTPTVTYLVTHTAEVPRPVVTATRALMDAAFAGDFGDDDWDHCLGGLHVVARSADEVVGHAAVVQRRLVTGGRALRSGYVEGVAVHPDWQRRGIGGEIMTRAESIVHAAYDLGALGTTDEGLPLYTSHGWVRWRGPLAALTPGGTVPTPGEQDAVLVLPVPSVVLDLDGPLTCDWRDGDLW
jgi:aminoglycoside 2'-N-acetyltransferase I